MPRGRFKDAVPGWPDECLELLNSLFPSQGKLSPDVVTSLCTQLELNVGQLAEQLIDIAKTLSIAPISNFQVGAVGIGTETNAKGIPSLYLGANFEIAGAPLTYTLHAEQSVMSLVLAHGDQLSGLVLSTVPCGYCRQFLWEFCFAQSLPIIIPGEQTKQLNDYLPSAFGPIDLGVEATAPASFRNLSQQFTSAHNIAAQAAANHYAPYTGTQIGCAVSYHSGVTYPGIYIENAAHNPTVSPLWVALNLARASEADFDIAHLESLFVHEVPGGVLLKGQMQAEWLAVAPDKPIQYELSAAH